MQWLKFGDITNNKYGRELVVTLPKVESQKTTLDEAISTVRQIVSTYPAPYTLMLSGGVDSQAMLWAWLKSGVEFDTLCVTYDDMNNHDIETLEKFVAANHIELSINYKNIDVIHFLEDQVKFYAIAYNCSSPQICTHMYLSELVEGGTKIFSGNFIASEDRGGPSLSFAILGIDRYLKLTKSSIVPFFFLHTPELAYAFIKHDDVTIPNGYGAKIRTYQSAGFPVIAQPNKYTGFERIKDLYDQYPERVSVEDKLEFAFKPSKRVFDQHFRYPYEKLLDDPRLVFKFV